MPSLTTESLINIESEIAPLKKVLIHTPGPEVECMAPKDVEKFLFHGVIFLKDLLKGYSVFKKVLSSVSEVYELKECLEEVLSIPEAREFCLNQILEHYGQFEIKNELMSFDSPSLVKALIEGFELRKSTNHNSLASFISEDRRYALQPLPNLYFTRDTTVVVGDKYFSSHMAHAVRFTETILTRTIFKFHKDFKNTGPLLDAQHPGIETVLRIEGGDVHIWGKDLYLIGLSVRTNAPAIDGFVNALIKARKLKNDHTPFHILTVTLPKTRTMIHLDMIFTRVSAEQALAYAPAISGAHAFKIVKISVDSKGAKSYTIMDNLLHALKSVNSPIEPIYAGGKNSLVNQQREQWVSGTNSFAFGPGKIISYENEHTLRELESAGFSIIDGKNFLREKLAYSNLPEKVVVSIDGSQLSQGGGGPRCMTCPVLRSNVI